MSVLYSTAMLRQAVELAKFPLLDNPDVRSDGRTPVCGSRITVDLMVDGDGQVSAVGVTAHACAVGQAAAALMVRGAVGKTTNDFAQIAVQIDDWLTDDAALLPAWPGFDLLAAVRAYPARHAALALPFRVALNAMQRHNQERAA